VENSHSKFILQFAAAGASLAALGAHAAAQQTIVQDIFTSGSQYAAPLANTHGKTPGLPVCPTNLPGGNWQHITGAFYDAKEFSGNMGGMTPGGDRGTAAVGAAFHNNTASGIPLGSYNTGTLHISAGVSFLFSGTNSLPDNGACILVGFASGLNSASNYGPSPFTAFTGLAVTGSGGALQEYVNGSPVGQPIAFVGSYGSDTETILSYTINTSTGAISDVCFGESRANYSFPIPKAFSQSYTSAIEIGGNAGVNSALISSFILRSVAPPMSASGNSLSPAPGT
jgi:hypothetical protein